MAVLAFLLLGAVVWALHLRTQIPKPFGGAAPYAAGGGNNPMEASPARRDSMASNASSSRPPRVTSV